MPVLSDELLLAFSLKAGFSDVKWPAIWKAESGGNTEAVGDQSLENATWGPSIGLAQIRTLKAETGKGTSRDNAGNRLMDPTINLAAAWEISSHGRNPMPWSAYKNGSYKQHLKPMAQIWYAKGYGTAPPLTWAEEVIGKTLLKPVVAGADLIGKGVVAPIADAASAVGDLASVAKLLSEPGTWKKVAMVAGGIAAVGLGAAVIFRDLALDAALSSVLPGGSKTVKAVAGVVA